MLVLLLFPLFPSLLCRPSSHAAFIVQQQSIAPTAQQSAPVTSPPMSAGDQAMGGEQPADELLFVQTIWRHGDRTPIYTYPSDPNQEQAWPQGFAELTTRGMAQHVKLGKFLRNRYIEQLRLLSPQYRREEVFVISTDTNRTIQSATANLIGMFGGSARWGVDYPDIPDWPSAFIPIPVHTYEFKKDPVGYARNNCQRTLELFELSSHTPEFQQLNQSSAALLQKISEYAGVQISLSTLWAFIETVNIESTHGLSPPDWALQILPQTVDINTRLVDFNSGLGLAPLLGVDFSLEVPKMLGGTLLWELIERMGKKVDCAAKEGPTGSNRTPKGTKGAEDDIEGRGGGGEMFISDGFGKVQQKERKAMDQWQADEECQWLGKLKYHAHSAHDMTLAALFSTFQFDHVDFDRNGFPGYTSCVMVELWRRNADHFVRVLYRRDDKDDLIDLTPHIRGCENGCSLDQFRARSQPFRAEPDLETLCRTPLIFRPGSTAQLRLSSSSSQSALPNAMAGIALLLLSILLSSSLPVHSVFLFPNE